MAGDFSQVLTVDGASGAGKTTLLMALERRYACRVVETGPVVRTVAWWAHHHRLPIADAVAAIARHQTAGRLRVSERGSADLAASEVVVAGAPMRQRIFSGAIAEALAVTSLDAEAMAWIYSLIRAQVVGGPAVVSGRHAGIDVCPSAGLHIRLEAEPAVRAARKMAQFAASGLRSAWRDDAWLLPRPVVGQVVLDTTGHSATEMQEQAFLLVERRLSWRPRAGDLLALAA